MSATCLTACPPPQAVSVLPAELWLKACILPLRASGPLPCWQVTALLPALFLTIVPCCLQLEVKFPILGDEDREISTKYGMLDPNNKDSKDLPLTIRQGLHQHCCSLHRAAC